MIASIAGAAMADSAPAASAGVVNLNTADVAQLSYLPRVGAKAAQRIVDYRTQHGPFHKTTDLMQVKGFGEKRFNQVSVYLTVDGKTTLSSKISAPRKPRKSASRQQPTSTASN
jgi:competence protein ComEA